MSFCVLGFRKREGIVMKRSLQVVGSKGSSQNTVVSLATSCGVSWLKMLPGTVGCIDGSTCEKSPVQSAGWQFIVADVCRFPVKISFIGNEEPRLLEARDWTSEGAPNVV